MLLFTGLSKISYCISGREAGTAARCSLHVQIPLNTMILLVLSACQSDYASQSYAFLSGLSTITQCISEKEGGTRAQRSLHLQIPLNHTMPAVPSACQSDHVWHSYANAFWISDGGLGPRNTCRYHYWVHWQFESQFSI